MRTDWVYPAAIAVCMTTYIVWGFLLASVRDEFLNQRFDSLNRIRSNQVFTIDLEQKNLEKFAPSAVLSNEALSEILSDRGDHSYSGQSYMVASSGGVTKTWSIITLDRFSQVGDDLLHDIGNMPSVERALSEVKGNSVSLDYRGVSVLSAYQGLVLGGNRYILLVEISEDEVLSHYYKLRLRVWGMTGLLWIGIFAVASYGKSLVDHMVAQEKENEELRQRLSATIEIVSASM